MGPRSRAGELVRALNQESAEFARAVGRARRWPSGSRTTRSLLHPQLGEIELDCQALHNEDHAQVLLVLTAEPRSEAAEKLHLLAVLGTERFPEDVPNG